MNKYQTIGLLLQSASANQATTGVCAGGWMVLEPWITPSLFYRFLGKTKDEGVGIDSWTFCEALGPEEGNKVMRAHWDAWYTEDHIKALKDREIEIIRLPIGDWTLNQYGPYVGCMDGADEKIQWFLDTCHKYDIKVLMDVHAMKDSQNGYDNSGKATDIIWKNQTHFEHDGAARWFGNWNQTTQQYDDINYAGVEWALQVHETLLKRWGKHPAFYAFEPINEPQTHPIIDQLKKFYVRSRALVKEYTNDAWFVFHDAGIKDNDYQVWNGLFDESDDKVAIDIHYYQAWSQPNSVEEACNAYSDDMASIADKMQYPVWVGEWSLATDICAHWLGGFNDGMKSGHTCNKIECPHSYMKSEVVDFDRSVSMFGPYGSGDKMQNTIQEGYCSYDSSFFNDDQIKQIGSCALKAFDDHVNATFMWTAHNEIEPRWDYIRAYDQGWLNRLDHSTGAKNAIFIIIVLLILLGIIAFCYKFVCKKKEMFKKTSLSDKKADENQPQNMINDSVDHLLKNEER